MHAALAQVTLAAAAWIGGASSDDRTLAREDGMPVPVVIVPDLPLPRGNWRHNAGWSERELSLEHEVVGPALVVRLLDGDGFSGAPLVLRFEETPGGASVTVAGRVYSCVGRGTFLDVHGEVRVEERGRASQEPLRVAFRLDAIDSELQPLRTEGAFALALTSGEWEHELCGPPEGAPLRGETWLRWPDGAPRAHGWVDVGGRREGIWETWYPSGALASMSVFARGERHGEWFVAEESGGYACLGTLEHGVASGIWTEILRSEGAVEIVSFDPTRP